MNIDGIEEQVAVKTIALQNLTPRQEAFARRELSLMCTISHELSGHVIELKGFHLEAGSKLIIAMELAHQSLQDWLCSLPRGQISAYDWVRACTTHAGMARRVQA